MSPERVRKIADAITKLQSEKIKPTVRSVHAIVRGSRSDIATVLKAFRRFPSGKAKGPHGMASKPSPSGDASTAPPGSSNGPTGTAREQELPIVLTLERTAGLVRSLSALGVAAQRSCARTALARSITDLCIQYGLISPIDAYADEDGSQGRTDSAGRPITNLFVQPPTDIPLGCDGRASEIPIVVVDHGATAIPAVGSTNQQGATERVPEGVSASS